MHEQENRASTLIYERLHKSVNVCPGKLLFTASVPRKFNVATKLPARAGPKMYQFVDSRRQKATEGGTTVRSGGSRGPLAPATLATIALLISAAALLASGPVRAELPEGTPASPRSGTVQNEADTKLSGLLTQIQAAIESGHLSSPDKANATAYLSDALSLLPQASSEGLDMMRSLPGVLKQRAQQDYTQGRWQSGANFDAFAAVLSSMAAFQERSSHPAAGSAAAPESPQPGPVTHAAPQPPVAAPVASAPPAPSTPSVSIANQQATPSVSPAQGKAVVVLPAPERLAMTNPPMANLPMANPPMANPPIANPPAANPPVTTSAMANPPMARPPAAKPPPDSAGPNAAPKPAVLDPAFVQQLMQRGDALIILGDISGARRLYTLAAQNNSREAALKLGDTYTPDFLARHGVEGLPPDLKQAHYWYEKAAALGDADAQQRMTSIAR
ncbi:MAG TPA: hypothetical protein VIZ17_12390, partial [Acetobacteraceae bacterium]